MIRRNKEILSLYASEIITADSTDLNQTFIEELRAYKFQDGETIADIGGGIGSRSLIMSMLPLKLTIYTTEINKQLLQYQNTLYKGLPNKFRYNKVEVIKGSKNQTNLPTDRFDKILMTNTFHHLKKVPEMLSSIHDNLKPNGTLFVLEDLRSNQFIPYCIHQITEEDLIDKMAATDFVFVEKIWIGKQSLFIYNKK